MKLDYEYIKRMLILMEEEETHEFNLYKINDNFTENDPTHNIEKLAHHLSIMSQEGLIDSYSDKNKFGLIRVSTMSGRISYMLGPTIFITAQGHGFLVALSNDTFFKKLKKHSKELTLSIAIELGKQAILKTALDFL